MKRLVLTAVFVVTALSLWVTAAAAAPSKTVVGTIHGGGTANMMDIPSGLGGTLSSFAVEVTLFSDGSARGHFDCADHMGDVPGYPGNIFGDIARWSGPDANGLVTLYVTDGRLVLIPGGPVFSGGLHFAVRVQRFGDAGVGRWTLDIPGQSQTPPIVSPFNGGPICQELLTSGQIVRRGNFNQTAPSMLSNG